MACLSLNLPHPTVPTLLLPNPSFVVSINVGVVGITCCQFKFPGVAVDLSGPIQAAIGVGGPLVIALNVALAAMQVAIDVALATLDQIHVPDCPRE